MTSSDLVQIIGAVAAATALVLSAVGALWVKVHGYRAEVNGKMTQLLELTRTASLAQGQLEGERKVAPDPPAELTS